MDEGLFLASFGVDLDEPLRVVNSTMSSADISPLGEMTEDQFRSVGISARNGKPELLGWLLCALISKVADLETRLVQVEMRGRDGA